MMARGTFRGRWRREVFATKSVTATVKLTLLALAESMREDGYVSVPLHTMSARIGRDERRVLEHYTKAVDAGLLARVSRGRIGQTAVYRASLPSHMPHKRVTKTSTLLVGQDSTLSGAFPQEEGAGNRHPNRERDSPATGTPDRRSAPALGSEEKNNQPLPAYDSDPWMETA